MKKIFLILIILLNFSQSMYADPTDSLKKIRDSIQKVKIDSAKKVKDDSIKNAVASTAQKNLKTDTTTSSSTSKDCGCTPHYKTLDVEWIIVFAPLIVFFIIFFSIGIVKDFKLSEALTENEQPKKTILNSQYSVPNIQTLQNLSNLSILLPPTVDVSDPQPPAAPVYRASISRYIAFITSMLTITIAVCISCFYIYQYIHTSCPPDLSALSPVLIALGIGVAPYAFNKVSAAVAKDKS